MESPNADAVLEFTNPAFEDSEQEKSDSKEKPGDDTRVQVTAASGVDPTHQPTAMKEMTGMQDDSEDPDRFVPRGFRKMYLATLAVLQFAVCMGFTTAYSATATTDMKRNGSSIHPDGDQVTWIGSLVTLGALAGGTAGGYCSNALGRQGTLVWNSLPYAAGWLFVAHAPTVGLVYVGRLLSGFSTGIVSVVTPMYLVEISTPEVRGLLGSAFQLFVVIGVLIVNSLGSVLSWRKMAAAGGIASLLSAAFMLFMPESPRWLLGRGRRDEAKKALAFLQGEAFDAEQECSAIEKEIKQQPAGRVTASELLVPSVSKPFLLSILLMFFQQCSGVNAILFYTNDIFVKAKVPLDPTTATIIVSLVQVFATLAGSLLMDRAGRRVLLVASGSCMAVSLFVFSGYSLSAAGDPGVVDRLGWMPVVSLTAFIAAFSIGFGPTPWLMVAEMTPARYRSVVCGVSTALNWTFAFCVTKSFDFLNHNMKDYGLYAFYGTICASSLVVTIFFLPETKGKQESEIEEFFKRDIAILARFRKPHLKT